MQYVFYGRIVGLQPHDTGASEHDSQLWVKVVTLSKFLTPIGLLEYLVKQQDLAAIADKLSSEIGNAIALKIKVVHVHIKTLAIVLSKFLFGILKKEGGLSNATCALYANKPMTPIDFIHEATMYRSMGMIDKIGMCLKERFHQLHMRVFAIAKIQVILFFAKSTLQELRFLVFFNDMSFINKFLGKILCLPELNISFASAKEERLCL